MALIYDNFVLLPVGMSCQFAHQLRHQKGWLDAMLGEVGTLKSTPLDWQIAPASAAKWQIEREEFLPSTPGEIERRRSVPGFPDMYIHFWAQSGSSYWHEPKLLPEFDRVRNKFSNMTKTWKNLKNRRVLAVFSNNQKNLDAVADLNPELHPIPCQADLSALGDTLKRCFKHLHFHCVFLPDRVPIGLDQETCTYSIYRVQDDELDWRGNDTEWRRLLSKILQSGGVRQHRHAENH